MEDIKKWLESGRDFADGRELYKKYGSSGNLKKLFEKKGRTRYNQSKLEYELKRLISHPKNFDLHKKQPSGVRFVHQDGAPGKAEAVPIMTELHKSFNDDINPDFKFRSQPDNPQVVFDDLPEELKPEYLTMVDLSRKRAYLHGTLEFLPTDEQRKQNAEEIEKITDKLDVIWKKLDYWRDNGMLMEERKKPEPKEMNVAELMQKRANLRSERSKKKKDPEAVARLTSEIDELTRQLDAFQNK